MNIFQYIKNKFNSEVFPIYCFHFTTKSSYEKYIKSKYLQANEFGSNPKIYGIKTVDRHNLPKWACNDYLFLMLEDKKHINAWIKSKEFQRLVQSYISTKNDSLLLLRVKILKSDKAWVLEGRYVFDYNNKVDPSKKGFSEKAKVLF